MEPTKHESTTNTQSCKGGVIGRFLSLEGKRKIRFGRTDTGVLSPRVRAMLSDTLMSKILVGKIMEARKVSLKLRTNE